MRMMTLCFLFFITACVNSTIPPRDLTLTHMHVIRERIVIYATSNHAAPNDLTLIPKIHGKTNSILDGWGNSITYTFNEDTGIVLLSSLGPNGIIDSAPIGDDGIYRSFQLYENGKLTDDAHPRWID